MSKINNADNHCIYKIAKNPYNYLLTAALFPKLNISEDIKNFIFSHLHNEANNDNFLNFFLKYIEQYSIKCSVKQVQKACDIANLWMEQKICVFINNNFQTENSQIIPHIIFGWGNTNNFQGNLASVLSSRKQKHVKQHDNWIHIINTAVTKLIEQQYNLITSFGNYPYEIAAYSGSASKGNLIIVLDRPLPMMQTGKHNTDAFLNKYKEFINDNTLIISIFAPDKMLDKSRYTYRDAFIIEISDLIVALEIREKGNMEKLICQKLKKHGEVKLAGLKDAKLNEHLLKYGAIPYYIPLKKCGSTKVNKKPQLYLNFNKIYLNKNLNGESYLIHFTRSCQGNWPGQTLFDYYRSLINQDNNASHTAYDTLRRILDEGLIRAYGKLIRGNIPCISFTECNLSEIKNLIIWRKGLIRWTFEPFGIAVSKELLLKIGAMPVIYGEHSCWNNLEDNEKFRFQLSKSPVADWSNEKEWRIPFDLKLTHIPKQKIKIIVPSEEEAINIANDYGYDAYTFKNL
ncbi:MAG: hypothetical protein HQK76_18690 [Desulfobacterales bacterium]|nr:hypothetical protein [Desulfobacterales bacterium]